MDPLAQALHLPGAGGYVHQQQQNEAGKSAYGPYTGVTPTLAAANAGYAPGGPGANPGYKPWQNMTPGGFVGSMQKIAGNSGNMSPNATSWAA